MVDAITRGTLPACMAPDGADPCAHYRDVVAALTAAEAERDALKTENERLKTQLAALNDDGALHAAYISGQLDAKAENERLREALKPFAECADQLDATTDRPAAPEGEWAKFRLLTDDFRRARAALTGDANG